MAADDSKNTASQKISYRNPENEVICYGHVATYRLEEMKMSDAKVLPGTNVKDSL